MSLILNCKISFVRAIKTHYFTEVFHSKASIFHHSGFFNVQAYIGLYWPFFYSFSLLDKGFIYKDGTNILTRQGQKKKKKNF